MPWTEFKNWAFLQKYLGTSSNYAYKIYCRFYVFGICTIGQKISCYQIISSKYPFESVFDGCHSTMPVQLKMSTNEWIESLSVTRKTAIKFAVDNFPLYHGFVWSCMVTRCFISCGFFWILILKSFLWTIYFLKPLLEFVENENYCWVQLRSSGNECFHRRCW